MSAPIPSLDKVKSILIVKTSSIGDVVHALPVAEMLRKSFPHLEIGWAVRSKSKGVLLGNPHIDHLHILPDSPSVTDLLRFRREAAARAYAIALDLQGLFLSGLLTMLSGAPVRIGLDNNREFNSVFMTHPVVPSNKKSSEQPLHAVDVLLGFLSVLGVRSVPSEFPAQSYLCVPDEQIADVVDALPRLRAAFNVGASSMYKQWPAVHWAALTSAVLAKGHGIVFLGDNNDRNFVDEIWALLPDGQNTENAVNMAGLTELRSVPGVIAQCDYMVTGDTGPMHLAVAVGTPTIALFGATDPLRTGPYGSRNTVLDMYLGCSPCFRKPTCEGRVDCMRMIEPVMVLSAIDEIASRSGELA